MEYSLAIENTPETVPGGTGILLLHPSTGETDRIDTEFLASDTDAFLIISTRTTAREVQQKLEYYGVVKESESDARDHAAPDPSAFILDTLSVERGYSRRASDNIHYVSAPDDLDGIVEQTKRFFAETDGKRRISVDSITEMAYYADEERAAAAVERLLDLLVEHDAVGLFHLSSEVHDAEYVGRYEALFDGVIELREDGTVTSSF